MNGELCLLWRTNERTTEQTNAFFFPSFASNLRNNIVRLSFRSILRPRARTEKCSRRYNYASVCKKGSRRWDAHAGLQVIVGVRTLSSKIVPMNLVDCQI